MKTKFIIKRILEIIPVILGITILVFFIMRMIPGNPAQIMLGQDATPEEVERLTIALGYDQNIFIQLANYLKNMLVLDFGDSIFQNQSVSDIILGSFPATMELAIVALIISLIIAVPLGILSAIKQNTWIDYISTGFAQLGISMPVFWIGTLFILYFSVELKVLPSFGRGEPIIASLGTLLTTGSAEDLIDSFKHILLPGLALGIMGSAMVSRMIRSSMLEVLDSDYIRTARAKGTSEKRIIMKHAFRNALLPVITVVGLQFGALLGGSIVTETVFSWPGVGRIIITAISQRDYPLVQGGIIFLAVTFAIVNLLVDLLYTAVNPKIDQ